MIHETIQEILAIEEEVENMKKQALEDARISVQKAEEEEERITREVIESVKKERAETMERAKADGEMQAQLILASGKQNADRIKETASCEKAVEMLKERVFSQYVHH